MPRTSPRACVPADVVHARGREQALLAGARAQRPAVVITVTVWLRLSTVAGLVLWSPPRDLHRRRTRSNVHDLQSDASGAVECSPQTATLNASLSSHHVLV